MDSARAFSAYRVSVQPGLSALPQPCLWPTSDGLCINLHNGSKIVKIISLPVDVVLGSFYTVQLNAEADNSLVIY